MGDRGLETGTETSIDQGMIEMEVLCKIDQQIPSTVTRDICKEMGETMDQYKIILHSKIMVHLDKVIEETLCQ